MGFRGGTAFSLTAHVRHAGLRQPTIADMDALSFSSDTDLRALQATEPDSRDAELM
jgi:hypothetical protein